MKKKGKRKLNIILFWVAAVAALGIVGDPRWRIKMYCVGVILLVLATAIAFTVRSQCNVFEPGMKRPCQRPTWGVLLGCRQDHAATKLMVWLRYLGAGRFMRHIGIVEATIGRPVAEEHAGHPVHGSYRDAMWRQNYDSETTSTSVLVQVFTEDRQPTKEFVEFVCLLVSTVASVIAILIPPFLS